MLCLDILKSHSKVGKKVLYFFLIAFLMREKLPQQPKYPMTEKRLILAYPEDKI